MQTRPDESATELAFPILWKAPSRRIVRRLFCFVRSTMTAIVLVAGGETQIKTSERECMESLGTSYSLQCAEFGARKAVAVQVNDGDANADGQGRVLFDCGID